MGRYEAETTRSNPFSIFYSPEARKFQTVVIGVLVAAATAGLLPAAIATWVLLVVGVLTATGVYVVPNKTPEATPVATSAPVTVGYAGNVAD